MVKSIWYILRKKNALVSTVIPKMNSEVCRAILSAQIQSNAATLTEQHIKVQMVPNIFLNQTKSTFGRSLIKVS